MSTVSLSMSRKELTDILEKTAPGRPLFPELEEARKDLSALGRTVPTRMLLKDARELVDDLYPLPQTTYTLYREFQRTGERYSYQEPYFQKRSSLTAASLALLFGREDLLDAVQDYIWNICEETNWVIPAHEWQRDVKMGIDLFAAETGFQLAETIVLLEGTLNEEIIQRVEDEIEQRIFQNYLADHDKYWWYQGHNNWNGVCNSSVGNTFLILEEDTDRLAQALSLVLDGLETFLDTAFEEDGGSTEGVGYWRYGLMNMVCLSEMLRQRTQGRIDILESVDKMERIAVYPLKMMLSAGRFANFSDSDEQSTFPPGIIARLAERTGQTETKQVLAGSGAQMELPRRLPMALRTMLWWDGGRPEEVTITDAQLPEAGVARLVSETGDGTPVVVAFKAGHNAENHNQNDVGSFIVHVGGETFLCDPGRGLYSRQYFSDQRYENVFANSYGHSVPVIDGELQAAGRAFAGDVLAFDPEEEPKQIVADLGDAYPVERLESLRRTIQLTAEGEDAGRVTLTDAFSFETQPESVEEAFVTWLDVDVEKDTATVHGAERDLKLTIEAPSDATFALESLDEACEANEKPEVLKRLTIGLPAQASFEASVRMDLLPA